MALPIIGHFHLLGPLLHISFRNLAARYGPLFSLRLGSNQCVIASTPEMAKELLKNHDLTFSTRARKHALAIDKLTYNSSFAFAPYGSYWRFIKKYTTFELLGNVMLRKFIPLRTFELRQFLTNINDKAKVGETVNLSQELIKLINNIITQMMMSVKCSGSDNQAENVRKLVREVTQLFGAFNLSDLVWFLKYVDLQGFRKKIDDVHLRYDTLLEGIIREREVLRKKNKSDGGVHETMDLLDMLLDAMEDRNAETKITREHIKAMVLDFTNAATDTTAITLEWALAELINNPTAMARAREEIKNVVGEDRLLQESDNKNLPYIQAVIKETLRLHPPITSISRISIEDCEVNGYTIPSNTMLFVNIWSIGRDPNYWKDPLKFQPERFLNGDFEVRGQQYEFLPFGTGRRSCPGISLAMLELPVTIAAMLQCFDLKPINPQTGMEMKTVDMSEKHGLTTPRAQELVIVPVARAKHLFN